MTLPASLPRPSRGRLGEICTREGVESEPEALQVVARRAGGSLRDAQSLLDRLLASGSPKLTVEVVHSLLGTATDERLLKMFEALAGHDSAAALGLLEQSAGEGVQPAELLSGLIDLIRDAMILAVGGAESMLLAISPRNRAQLKSIVDRWTLDSIMASLQILQECRARMRGSIHGRLLLEIGPGSRRPPRRAHVALDPGGTARGARVRGAAAQARDRQRQDRSRARPPTAGRRRPRPPRRAEVRPQPADRRGCDTPPARGEARPRRRRAIAALAPKCRRTTAAAPGCVVPCPVTGRRFPSRRPRPPARARPDRAAHSRRRSHGSSRQLPFRRRPPLAPAAAAARSSALAVAPAPRRDRAPLDLDAVRKLWPDLVKKVGTGLGWKLAQVEPIELEGPGRPGHRRQAGI